MEVLEFFQCYYKMCASYVNGCAGCEAQGIDCELTTAEPEKLVAAVERWAKAHPEEAERERQKAERERQKAEQNDAENHRTTSNELSIEDMIRILEQDMRIVQNFLYEGVVRVRHGHWKRYEDCGVTRCSVCDYSVEEYIEFRYCPYCGSKMDEDESVDKPKRTNKDVLLAAFPNARMDNDGIPDVCPLTLDTQYDCNKFPNCLLCKRTHWLAEVEE